MARKEKRYHYIYKTTNIITGRYYYGMHNTDNLDDGYLGSGKRLRYSINKYGKENHKREIIEFCNDRGSLKLKEKEIVNLNEIAKDDCMNLKIGGDGGFISEEQQRHRSKCANIKLNEKRKKDADFNKQWKKNHRNGILKAYIEGRKLPSINYDWNGKKHSEETKRKIGEINSIKQIGENNSQYGTCWITNGVENKKIKKNTEIPFGWKLGRTIKN